MNTVKFWLEPALWDSNTTSTLKNVQFILYSWELQSGFWVGTFKNGGEQESSSKPLKLFGDPNSKICNRHFSNILAKFFIQVSNPHSLIQLLIDAEWYLVPNRVQCSTFPFINWLNVRCGRGCCYCSRLRTIFFKYY